jgi:hypothetical protein
MQSSPDTIDGEMVTILRMNAWAYLALSAWFITRRYRLAAALSDLEQPPPLPEAA